MLIEGTEGLGAWVREWRHDNRWTQERLAEALGYDVSYIAKIEQGRRQSTSQFVARLADVLATPKEELLRLSRRPSNRLRLPLPTGPLLGRAREVAGVSDLLRGSARCVTLVGAPGIGKTSLAVEVAWQVADSFRHGACFVPLADVSSVEAVAPALVHALGLFEQPGRAPEEVVAQAVRDREMLLVVDNVEHVLAAGEFLNELVHKTPRLRILATSREALGLLIETVYPVPRLAFPEGTADLRVAEGYAAVKVFVSRSRVARPDFGLTAANVGPVAEICARLDGLPLAISLAAAASRMLSPADIVRSLRGRLELPTDEMAGSASIGRLTSALDWSWNLLDPSQQALLARLGVFAGSCTLSAVEAVCSVDGEDVLAGLTALVSKSLLESVQTDSDVARFTALETVRRYSLERLRACGALEELRARHCDYYVEVAENAEPHITGGKDQGHWLRLLEDEHANLSAALDWALQSRPHSALRLSAALWRFFSMRRITEGRRWLDAALDGAPDPTLVRVRALNGAAVLARAQGDLERATSLLGQARAMAQELGSTRELALAVLNVGIVEEQKGLIDSAEAHFETASSLYREVGDARGVGHSLNCLGVISLHRNNTESATAFFLEALTRFRSMSDRWSVAVTTTNLGWIAEMNGELGEARDWYEESRQIWEAVGDEHGLGRSVADLGRVARRQRQSESAGELLEAALQVFYRLGDRRLAAACLLELAAVAAQRKRSDQAARLLGAAQGVRDSLGTPAWADERALQEQIMEDLRKTAAEKAVLRARNMGRALSLEDAVEMVECGTWPPVSRRRLA